MRGSLNRRLGTAIHRTVAWLQILVMLAWPVAAQAEPTDPTVVGGSASVSRPDPATTLIKQQSDRAIINWKGFSINVNELVRFDQPSAGAVALNRVTGQDPSTILGRLSANGRVFLINPNGVVFGPGARVDVAGLLATTFDIKDKDFMAGKFEFQQDPQKRLGAIVNKGEIRVSDDGFVFLVAPAVANEGLIVAKLGKVVLASGSKLVLDFNGDGLVNYAIEGQVLEKVVGTDGVPLASLVANSGEIQADGGSVVMHARGPGDVFSSVVNNSGIVRARSLKKAGGVVRLEASSPVLDTAQVGRENNLGRVPDAAGTVVHSGTIDVSPAEADALPGAVTLTGERVGLSGEILALAGNVLVRSTLATVVTRTGLIDVSATPDAAAGTTVVWSDRNTRFYGTIRARGTVGHPDGGSAEVSGAENLGFDGLVDLGSAPGGVAGTLLLDPGTVQTGSFGTNDSQITGDAQILFADGLASDWWYVSAAALEGLTANINIQALDTVILGGPLNLTNLNNGETLSVNAGSSIYVTGTITAAGGNVDLVAGISNTGGLLNVGAAITTTNRIYLENDLGTSGIVIDAPLNTSLVTLGGRVLMVASSGPITQNPGGNIKANFLGLLALGNVSLNGSHQVNEIAGQVTGPGNSFSYKTTNSSTMVSNDLLFGGYGNYVAPATSGVTTNNGSITIDVNFTGQQLTLKNDVNAGSGAVDLHGTAGITLLAGSTVTANGGLVLEGDQMTISPTATINVLGVGSVAYLSTRTPGRDIVIGGADSGTQLGLDIAELDRIFVTNGTIRVGAPVDGSLTVNAAWTPNAKALRLASGGTISQAGTAKITVESLCADVSGGGNVLLANDFNNVLNFAASTDGGMLQFRDALDLTLTTVDSIAGVATTGGNFQLFANSVTANPGTTINLGAGELYIKVTGGDISLYEANTFGSFYGEATGQLSVRETDGFILGTVGTGGLKTGGDALLEADTGGITVISTGQPLDLDVGGTLTLSAGGTNQLVQLNAGAKVQAGTVRYNADNISLNATSSSVATAGDVWLVPVQAATVVNLGGADGAGTLGLTNAELATVSTAAWVRVGSVGTINITSPITISTTGSALLLRATGAGATVTQSAGAMLTVSQLYINTTGSGNVTLDQNNDVDNLAASLTGAGWQFAFTDANDLAIGTTYGGVTTNNGAIALTAGSVTGTSLLTVLDVPGVTDVDAGTSTVTLRGNDRIALAAGSTVRGLGGVNYLAAGMNLSATSLTDAGTARASLTAAPATTPIALGGADAPGMLGLSDAELDTIKAGVIAVNTGDLIGVVAPVSPAQCNTLLLNGAGVSQFSTITVSNLAIVSSTAVVMDQDNDVDFLAAQITGLGEGFKFNNLHGFNVSGVGGVNGVSTNNGPIQLLANFGVGGGNLTVENTTAPFDVDAGSSTVFLTARDANQLLNLQPGAGVRGLGGVLYVADHMALDAGSTTNAGAGLAWLVQYTAGTLVNLGGADGAGTLGLTTAELNSLSAGIVRVGNRAEPGYTASGNLSVSAAINPSGTTRLALLTGGTITQTGAITVANLELESGGVVSLPLANHVNTLAALVVGAGNGCAFTNADPLNVGDVDLVSGITTSGGAISLTSGGDLVLVAATAPIVSGGGSIGLVSTAGSVVINDVNGAASYDVDAGAGTLTMTAGNGDVLTLGGATLRAAIANLTTGGADGDVGQSGTPLRTTAGTISFSATGTGEVVILESDGATISGTTAGGNVALVSITGDWEVGAAGVNTSAGSLVLTATAGDLFDSAGGMLTAGTLNLTAGGANGTIGATGTPLLTTAGAITFNGAGTGEVVITETDGATVNGNAGTGGMRLVTLAGNWTLGTLTTFGDALITANAGAILDDADGGANDITAAGVRLIAPAGVGVGNPIEITAVDLAGSFDTGGFFVTDLAGGLNITTVAGTVGILDTDLATAADVVVTAWGPLVVKQNVRAAGNVTLAANELSDAPVWAHDLTIEAPVQVESTTAGLVLTAGDDLFIDGTVLAASGPAVVTAGYQDLDGSGGLVMGGASRLTSATATVSTFGDARISRLQTTAGLTVVAGGSILDNSALAPNISSLGPVTLRALGGVIGTNADPLRLDVTAQVWIEATRVLDGSSAVLTGTISPEDLVHELVPSPGMVLWNNRVIGGSSAGPRTEALLTTLTSEPARALAPTAITEPPILPPSESSASSVSLAGPDTALAGAGTGTGPALPGVAGFMPPTDSPTFPEGQFDFSPAVELLAGRPRPGPVPPGPSSLGLGGPEVVADASSGTTLPMTTDPSADWAGGSGPLPALDWTETATLGMAVAPSVGGPAPTPPSGPITSNPLTVPTMGGATYTKAVATADSGNPVSQPPVYKAQMDYSKINFKTDKALGLQGPLGPMMDKVTAPRAAASTGKANESARVETGKPVDPKNSLTPPKTLPEVASAGPKGANPTTGPRVLAMGSTGKVTLTETKTQTDTKTESKSVKTVESDTHKTTTTAVSTQTTRMVQDQWKNFSNIGMAGDTLTISTISQKHMASEKKWEMVSEDKTITGEAKNKAVGAALDAATAVEKKAKAAEDSAKKAEAKAQAAEDKAAKAEEKAKAAEDKAKTPEEKAKAAADRAKAVEEKAKATEDKAKTPEEKAKAAADRAKAVEEKAKATEDKTKAAADKAKATEEKAKATAEKKKAAAEKSKVDKEGYKNTAKSVAAGAGAGVANRVLASFVGDSFGTGSSTSFETNAAQVKLGDKNLGATLTVGDVQAQANARAGWDKDKGEFYAEAGASFRASAVDIEGHAKFSAGPVDFEFKGYVRVATVSAEAKAGVTASLSGVKMTANAEIRATGVEIYTEAKASSKIGSVTAAATQRFMTVYAKAEANGQLNTDGVKVAGVAEAGASVYEVTGTATAGFGSGDWNMGSAGVKGSAVVGVCARAEGAVGFTRDEGFRFKLGAKVALGVGLELGIDFNIKPPKVLIDVVDKGISFVKDLFVKPPPPNPPPCTVFGKEARDKQRETIRAALNARPATLPRGK